MSSKRQSIPPTPDHLKHLEISLAPFTTKGRTFRVFGTETERMEYRWSDDGVPELVTIKEHRHHVLDVNTDERWWMPHDVVKQAQTALHLAHEINTTTNDH